MSEDILEVGNNTLLQTWGTANERGWLTLTGLNVEQTDDLTQEDEDHLILMISGMGDVAAWARGDFALRVRSRIREIVRQNNMSNAQYAEMWKREADRLARRFAVAPKTLLNNISTCSAWPPEHRVAGVHVRYKHHEAIPSHMPIEDRVHMLRSAEDGGWTWARLYAVAHGRLLPDGSQPGEMQKVADHMPQDIDKHLETMEPQEVDELELHDWDDDEPPYKMRNEPSSPHPYNGFDEDDGLPEEFEELQNGLSAQRLNDQSIRIAPAHMDEPVIPAMGNGVSITVKEQMATSLIVQESRDNELVLYVSFGNALTYVVKPDHATQTLIVRKQAE